AGQDLEISPAGELFQVAVPDGGVLVDRSEERLPLRQRQLLRSLLEEEVDVPLNLVLRTAGIDGALGQDRRRGGLAREEAVEDSGVEEAVPLDAPQLLGEVQGVSGLEEEDVPPGVTF